MGTVSLFCCGSVSTNLTEYFILIKLKYCGFVSSGRNWDRVSTNYFQKLLESVPLQRREPLDYRLMVLMTRF